MKELFDTYADRHQGVYWLKSVLTPKAVARSGKRGFSGAEFEFPTCPAFSRGVAQAAENGLFGYTLAGDFYRARVQWWMRHVRGFDIEPEWIVTTHGTIFSLATLIRQLTTPGQRIIIMPPCYNRYEQAAARLGRGALRAALALTCGRGMRDLVLRERPNPACFDSSEELARRYAQAQPQAVDAIVRYLDIVDGRAAFSGLFDRTFDPAPEAEGEVWT